MRDGATSVRRLPWETGASSDDGQALGASRLHQSRIVRDERNRSGKLSLQVHATCKLDGISRTKRMPQKKGPRIGRNLRRQFHYEECGYVAHERGQHLVALANCECPFAGTTDDTRGDLHLRKPTPRSGPRAQQAADRDASTLSDVALDQSARVEESRHIRSSRSSRMASDTDGPRPRMGRNAGSGRCSTRVTAPSACSCSSFASSVPARWIGFSSATGSPRSVITNVRPCRTCCRYPPRRVFSSRAPTVAARAMWS
jgi:hypothetical protein